MTETIRKYIQQYHMTAPGEAVCVGLSGGADSVCLLLVLRELCGRMEGLSCTGMREPDGFPVRLMAVHVNHCLRGEAADADERFVRELCGRYQIPLHVYRYPVADIAAEKGIGTEEAGRLVRQEAYRDCLNRHGATVIALAHHANDRAETFLFHAARGTSLAGMAGIRAVQPFSVSAEQSGGGKRDRTARIIRPLLCVTREEIEAWLKKRGQTWCTDETNRDESYSRNAIRHTVIPYLERQINRKTVMHIAEASADLEDADRFLSEEAERRAVQCVLPVENGVRISRALLKQPDVIQGYILLDALEKAGGARKDLGREQVRQLRELFRMDRGKQIDLPYGLCAVRESEGIQISSRQEQPQEENGRGHIPDPVPVEGEGICFWNGWQFRIRILDGPAAEQAAAEKGDQIRRLMGNIPRNKYTKWLDCDKIYGTLCIRSRQKGDRLIVNAQGGSRKLKDYLIDEKVPREERDGIPLLADGSRILWVIGYRIGEDVKVTEQTRHILEITVLPPAEEKDAENRKTE